MAAPRALFCGLAVAVAAACVWKLLPAADSSSLSFAGPARSLEAPRSLQTFEARPRAQLSQLSFSLTPSPARSDYLWHAAAAALAVAFVWTGRRTAEPAVALRAIGRIPVRQWAPQQIPPSKRRAPEDRIRIKMSSFHPVNLMETVEVLEDFAKTTGGEVEGPVVLPLKKLSLYIKKSPKGHKKAMYHKFVEEHTWSIDYYPPKEGGLDSIMQLKIPHTVHLRIE
eukprot:gb/GFBE01037964.1/.p1 GENE.gb/GFBE01037964.1/~~gb/GFBE01037964.1/.p1  ORF type:complete len:225 (+),score=43.81 gb/GFBE01037964.1/:1-675(+)